MLLPSRCADEFKATATIAKTRHKLRATVEKKCSDAVVAALPACGADVDALADAAAETGCLIESIDRSVDDAVHAEFGF